MEGTSQDLGALKEEFVHLMRLIHREQFHSAWTPKNLSKPEMHALMCIWIARTQRSPPNGARKVFPCFSKCGISDA